MSVEAPMPATVRGKLLLIAAVSVLAFLLIVAAGVASSLLTKRELDSVEARYVPLLELHPKLSADFERMTRAFQDAVAAQDADALDETEHLEKEFMAHLEAARSALPPGGENRVRTAVHDYYTAAFAVSKRLLAQETGEALIASMQTMQDRQRHAIEELKAVTAFDRAKLTDAIQSIRNAQRWDGFVRLVTAVVCMILVLVLSLRIVRGILRSLTELSAGLARFGEGRFNREIAIVAADELGAVAASANLMADRLRQLIEQRDKQAQELEERGRQLELANKELDGFSYSVSHDLRAPLRAIDGFTRILLEDYGEKLDAEGHRIAGIISNNTKKMGQLIDDLLAFSRMGRKSVDWVDVDMEKIVRTVFDDAIALEPERSIELSIGTMPPVVGDPALLRQVWQNLIANAVKYTRKQPKARIEVSGSASEREVAYSVKDNGVGFDSQYAGKLFGVFQRLHAANEFEGTGVGLALVSRIVQRHGGRVWAEGKLGEGATFSFALPRKEHGDVE
jgi:signal transduction histidine kinase